MMMTAFTDLHMPGRDNLSFTNSIDDLVMRNFGRLCEPVPHSDAGITVVDLPAFINRKRKRADTLPARFGKFVYSNTRGIRRKLGRETSEDRRAILEGKMERWDKGRAKREEEAMRMKARIETEIERRSRDIVCPLPRCPRLDRIVEEVLKKAEEKNRNKNLPRLHRSWMKLKKAVSKRVAKAPLPRYACEYEYTERGPDGVERLRHITNNNAWGSHEWEYADNVRRTPDHLIILEDRRIERSRQASAERVALERRWEQRMTTQGREQDRQWRETTRLFAEEFRPTGSRQPSVHSRWAAASVIETRDPEDAPAQSSETMRRATEDDTSSVFSVFDNDLEDGTDFFLTQSPCTSYDSTSLVNLAGSARERDDGQSIILSLASSTDTSTSGDDIFMLQSTQPSRQSIEYDWPSMFVAALEAEEEDDKDSVIFIIDELSEEALVQARQARPNGGLQPSQSFYGVVEY